MRKRIGPASDEKSAGEKFERRSDTIYRAFFSGKFAVKFFSVILSASREISIKMISSVISATDIPMIPDPDPISITVLICSFWMIFLARFMRHSVSSRGIRTSGVIKKSLPKK